MASKTIARRKTTEEEVAPQSQMLYGMSTACNLALQTEILLTSSPRGRDNIDDSSSQARQVQATPTCF
jgi:hypothetical protein